ncbi:MAG: DUF5050 domain-containing protein [Clostridia bacterium]
MFCKNCGVQNREGIRFCENCGTPLMAVQQPPKKSHALVISVIIGVVVVLGAGLAFVLTQTTLLSGTPPVVAPVVVTQNSSLVSEGVNRDDLGNVMNGQYIFDDGTSQFYSSFDKSNAPHIYKTEKSTGVTKSIFNGFGWSFAVYKDWLYFSGNEGPYITGTYNLYRISLDGLKIEKLRDIYCYGINFNKEWLYYVRKDNKDSQNYSVSRCSLDGKTEEILVQEGNGYCIIYNDKLYYSGKDGYLYNANPDGTQKVQIGSEKVDSFIIGGGKIIFLDATFNLRSSDIDGQNVKLIKSAMPNNIRVMDSYKGTIYYVNYNPKKSEGRNAFQYFVYKINMDGTNDVLVRQGYSTAAFINLLNDQLYVLDYARESAKGSMVAIAKSMSLDGANPVELYR